MSGLDIGRCFQRLKEFNDAQDWSLIHDGPDGQIHQRAHRSSTVVRMRIVENVPLEQLRAVYRPEFECTALNTDEQPFRRRIFEQLAPGDVLVEWCGLNEGALSSTELQSYRIMGMMAGAADLAQRTLMRATVWRDFPQEGHFSSIYIHSGEASVPAHQRGNMAYYIIFKSAGDGSVTMEDHYMEIPWPSCPDWWIPLLQENLESTVRRAALLATPEVIALAESWYVVTSLRSCTRGPPLLPLAEESAQAILPTSIADAVAVVQLGNYAWVPAKREGFNFPTYLQSLLRFLGFDARCVFDRLDGKKLAPYQAVLYGSTWGVAQESFQKLFDMQRAAYRRLHGGKSAPRVYFGTSPTFLDMSAEAPQILDYVTLRNTFVELTEASPTGQPRSAEYP